MGGGMMGGMGGGMGGMGGGMGGMGGGGGGFFSIPAEKTVSIPLNSVCLEHGKANPTPRMAYRIAKPSEVSDKPELNELLKLVGQNKVERGTAQAAHKVAARPRELGPPESAGGARTVGRHNPGPPSLKSISEN